MSSITEQQLRAAHCWEPDDRSGRPEMTEFRRRARHHQAMWREAHGHPIGTQPMNPRPGQRRRLVGSRLPLEYARQTGANFLTPAVVDAVQARLARKEPHQSLDRSHLWADLLWSPTLGFNLFGELAADLSVADRAVHRLWPDAPGTVSEVRFEYSPGWLDPEYLGNLSSFTVAVILDRGDGTRAMLALSTPYHDRLKAEVAKPTRVARYAEVTRRSGAFSADAIAALQVGDLVVTWLRHLLLHSMLQHPKGEWSWGRLVTVHPAGNIDQADACRRYRDRLSEASTFTSMTLEDLLASDALPPVLRAALVERYLPS